jgi:hypothetical protein
MENTTSLVKKTSNAPAFLEDSFQTLEKALNYANLLLESKLVPDHFYEKGNDNKPDYTKGKPGALLMVMQHGMELGFTPTQSLQQVVPINGLLTVKGDGCKSKILHSGFCELWKEEETGSIEKEDYSIKITSKRKDTGEQISRIFSVDLAKRAGLWITKERLSGQNGYKWKLSAWYKFPDRMIRYRALGFIARDLYPDVLQGSYMFEEVRDNPDEMSTTITTSDGNIIQLPESKTEHLKQISDNKSSSIVEDLEKKDELINSQKENQNKKEIKEDKPKRRGRPKKDESIENKAVDEKKQEVDTITNEEKKDEPVQSELSTDNKLLGKYGNQGEVFVKNRIEVIKEKLANILPLQENGERGFSEVNDLYFTLTEDLGISEEKFSNIKVEVLEFDQFTTLEDICFKGTEEQILKLIEKAK